MAGVKRWFMRITCAFFGLLFLVAIWGFTYEQMGRARDVRRLPARIGQAIDIGGRTLNLYCSGEGSPAVTLETGPVFPPNYREFLNLGAIYIRIELR